MIAVTKSHRKRCTSRMSYCVLSTFVTRVFSGRWLWTFENEVWIHSWVDWFDRKGSGTLFIAWLYTSVVLTVAHLIPTRSSRIHHPTTPLPARLIFRHVLSRLILASMAKDNLQIGTIPSPPGLKKIAPYWYPYTTMAKGRWFGREILEMVSTEFRDRSIEYYVSCLYG